MTGRRVIEVWHAAFEAEPTHAATLHLPSEPGLNTDDLLNTIYRLTNSIDHAWYENPDLELAIHVNDGEGARSTSCGDFIVLKGEGESIDETYQVATVGFRKVEAMVSPPLGGLNI